MSTVYSGDAKWETNLDDRRLRVQGHAHRRDHNTFALSGWFMLLVQEGPEAGRVIQLAHPDYEPGRDHLVPVRMPDEAGPFGPSLDIRFVERGSAPPEGGVPVAFKPDGYFHLVAAGVHHSIHTLSLDPPMLYLCVYTGAEQVSEILD